MNQEDQVIDGAHGEGGGQILRTALSLSALTGTPIHIENVRAGRDKPGLAAQHLTAVRAAASVCGADVRGDQLGSTDLVFRPRRPASSGDYVFDVAEARHGGSAGAASLVLQTVFLPLLFTEGDSRVLLKGGTHVHWSPAFDYIREVWLWTLQKMGAVSQVRLLRSGWYPKGGEEISLSLSGRQIPLTNPNFLSPLEGLSISGRAVVANLPKSIADRMRARIEHRLKENGYKCKVEIVEMEALDHGAWVFLLCRYGSGEIERRAGFDAYGERGKPAEAVADEAVDKFLRFQGSGATVEPHLADQLVLPAAMAKEASTYRCEITRHLLTQAWVVETFRIASVVVTGIEGSMGTVTIQPQRRKQNEPEIKNRTSQATEVAATGPAC